jgi:glucokinase
MVKLVQGLAGEYPDALAVGVGAAGLVTRQGEIVYAPNISGFRNAPIRDALTRELDRPVVVDNDANAAAHGELLHGAARGANYALVITLGTGVGGGIIARGRVIRGAHGFAAEVGHFQIDPDGPMCACGQRGHWEAFASGSALGRMGRERAAAGRAAKLVALAGGDADSITGVHVGDAAQAGDPDALEVITEYAGLVAVGLAGLANILDPDRIVISGGLVELGDTLFVPVRAAFAGDIEGYEYRPPIDIVPAQLGEHAGMIGAAALARELVEE